MSRSETLIAELTRECATTRRVLERVPEDKLSWRPHPKSMTLGQLAMHIARLPRSIAELATNLKNEVPNVPLPEATNRQELLDTLDQALPFATERLRQWGDAGLDELWSLAREGRTIFEFPRYEVIRNIMLNHTYHHRGQLSLYLRMLDVPVPSVYGPTADEKVFG